MNIYLVADYGVDDLAWAEVEAALRSSTPEVRAISRVSLPPFDTWACSLALMQLERGLRRGDIVFHNVAPRRDDIGARKDNAGEPLAAGWSSSGALFLGPNSGQSWSLVYPQLSSLQLVSCSDRGSQFRSRDVFPGMLPLLLARAPGVLGEALDPPEMPPNRVLAVDGYGNIKTSLQVDFPAGTRVSVEIGDASISATVVYEAFAVPEGEIALSGGSSSGLWEIFKRGSSAAADFGYPQGGSEIKISPL